MEETKCICILCGQTFSSYDSDDNICDSCYEEEMEDNEEEFLKDLREELNM